MDRDMLLRTWSVDALHSPGAQADTMITFRGDGTGFLEELNWGDGSVCEFQWTLVEASLRIMFRREFSTEGNDSLEYVGLLCEVYESQLAAVEQASLPVIPDTFVLKLPGFSAAVAYAGSDVFGYNPSLRYRNYTFPA